MTLKEIAQALQEHGFDTRIKGDTLVVYHGIVRLDSIKILDVFGHGDSALIESDEDGIRYGVDRVDGKPEFEQWLGVLEDRREFAEDGDIMIEIEEIDLEE